MNAKVEHVKKAKQTRGHLCHWPGCKEEVPQAKWGCSKHWFMLPKSLRDQIWATYRIGQEDDLKPSDTYLHVARKVQDWIRNRG